MISKMEYINDFLHITPGHTQCSDGGSGRGFCVILSCQVAHIVVSQRNFRDGGRVLLQGKMPLLYYEKNLKWRLRPE